MKLSVITVNLNDCDGLRATLASLHSQTFKDYEHLVIDGGSTDGSVDLIRAVAGALSFWCSERDAGIFHAMNKGVARASGEYILFLNAGDTLCNEDVLQNVFMKDWHADVLYGDSIIVGRNHAVPHAYPDPLTLEHLYIASIGHQSSFIRRDVFSRWRFNESARITADWELFLNLFLAGGSFRHLHLVISRFDATGISNRPESNEQQRLERLRVLRERLGPEGMAMCEARVAAAYLPEPFRELFQGRTMVLRALFLCGRTVRRGQSLLKKVRAVLSRWPGNGT